MKKIDKTLIDRAIGAIQSSNIANDKFEVPKEMKGYVSSFGAAVIQSGLIPAIIFFGSEKSDKDKAADRPKLISALTNMVNSAKPELKLETDTQKLKSLVEKLIVCEKEVEPLYIEAATALKLALRTYKEIDKPKKTTV